jgi:hypothetical protein
MALEYSYDHQAGLIHIVGHGTVSLDDRIHFIRRLLGDADLPARATVLVEVSGVTNAPSAEDIRVIGMLVERLQARFCGRVAIVNVTLGHVTLSHLVAFSVGDGYSRVQVFASNEEARDWLGC